MADIRRNKPLKTQDKQPYQAEFRKIKTNVQQLKKDHGPRITMQDELEKMYLMTWDEKSTIERLNKNFRVTISPSARNKLLGAVRLMVAADPFFSVPKDSNPAAVEDKADKLEITAQSWFAAASRLWGQPLHYDVVLSGLLWGEAVMAVSSTADMLKAAKEGDASQAAIARLEDAMNLTPYIFPVWDPRQCFAVYDQLGATTFYREYTGTAGELIDAYGKDALAALGSKRRHDKVKISAYWDLSDFYLWADDGGMPIKAEAHNKPGIPVISQIAEGSRLFSKEEHRRQPLLYGLLKSGLWKRENLALSVLFYQVFGIGDSPTLVHKRNNPNKHVTINRDHGIAIAEIEANEALENLPLNVVDQRVMDAMRVAEDKTAESTIYPQALGSPVQSSSATYSLTSLLAQAGRLPLISPQRRMAWLLADAMKFAFKCFRDEKPGTYKARYRSNDIELKPSDVPQRFELEAKLEVKLPQDQLQMVQVALSATYGDETREPLVSVGWARENIMQIGQSAPMTKEIWDEQSAQRQYQQFMQYMLQQSAPGGMPAAQPGQQPGAPMTDPSQDPRLVQMIAGALQTNNQQLIQQIASEVGPETVKAIINQIQAQGGPANPAEPQPAPMMG